MQTAPIARKASLRTLYHSICRADGLPQSVWRRCGPAAAAEPLLLFLSFLSARAAQSARPLHRAFASALRLPRAPQSTRAPRARASSSSPQESFVGPQQGKAVAVKYTAVPQRLALLTVYRDG